MAANQSQQLQEKYIQIVTDREKDRLETTIGRAANKHLLQNKIILTLPKYLILKSEYQL